MPRINPRASSILIRACPRCGGDLYRDMLEEDEFVCLQCGLRTYRARLPQLLEEREREAVGRR